MVARAVDRPTPDVADWRAPWLAAIAAGGRVLSGAVDPRAALNAEAERLGVRNAAGRPLRFAGPDAAGGVAYEAHIHATGAVPTRLNRHDLLNALVWLAMPRTKARLNALQATAIAAAGVGGTRGALRDAATLIDENGMLLVTTRTGLVDALRRHDWHALFIAQRSAWRTDVRAIVIGHALMDRLAAPYKAITAHALAVALPADTPLADVDRCVAAMLDPTLVPQRLLPLPVCGIPGWADNDDAGFYDDARVFRPAKVGGRQPRPGERR